MRHKMKEITPVGMLAIALLLFAHLGARDIQAQAAPSIEEAKRFIGTWRLVSDVSTGVMIYDNLGNMAVQVMPMRERQKFAGAQPTPDEAKTAITGYLAYFGTYTVDGPAHTITHHRRGSLNPGQVGEDAVRQYEFAAGNRLVLSPVGTREQIIWERAK
jgi:hypothetical protein